MSDKRVFKKDIIPDVDQMPAENTHARAKLIYRLLKAVAFMKREKQHIALQEIKDRNKILYDRVMTYLSQTTDEEIAFIKGPRPWYHDDGKLAIYHPIKDNPLLMRVYKGENPTDGNKKRIWLPR